MIEADAAAKRQAEAARAKAEEQSRSRTGTFGRMNREEAISPFRRERSSTRERLAEKASVGDRTMKQGLKVESIAPDLMDKVIADEIRLARRFES
jgi:hypothetical protein